MKVLYLDCGMGAAGDMLQSALVSLFPKEVQESFIERINNIGIDGIKVSLSDDMKCGITGKHVSVYINGEEELSQDVHDHEHEHSHEHHHEHDHSHEHYHDHDHSHEHHHDHDHDHSHEHHHDHDHEHSHDHEHDHTHDHHHHHTSMHDIEHMIKALAVSERVKKDALAVYKIVADAESKVHGKDVSQVHFHEVGMKDALADIVGVALLMEEIGAEKIVVSPINVGFGKVKCAHGILPVPAPATAEIIQGMPTYAGRFEGEMLTPTGAALLKYYADEYAYQPLMKIDTVGYGCGNKEFAAANVVKAVVGEVSDIEKRDTVIELRCNVDDMTGEEMAYATEVLLESGAKEAFVTPVLMKKGRSGMLLTVLCDENDKEKIASLVFKHTSTIGIREYTVNRMVLDREEVTVSTELGDIDTKVSKGYGTKRVKPEFESLKKIASEKGKSIQEVKAVALDALKDID